MYLRSLHHFAPPVVSPWGLLNCHSYVLIKANAYYCSLSDRKGVNDLYKSLHASNSIHPIEFDIIIQASTIPAEQTSTNKWYLICKTNL